MLFPPVFVTQTGLLLPGACHLCPLRIQVLSIQEIARLFRPTNNLWLSITSAFFSYAFALFAQNIRCGGGITFSFRKFLGKPRRPDLIKVSHSLGSTGQGSDVASHSFYFFLQICSRIRSLVFASSSFEYRIDPKPYDRPAPTGPLQDGYAADSRRFRIRCALIPRVEPSRQTSHRTSCRAPRRFPWSAMGPSPQTCGTAARRTAEADRSARACARSKHSAPACH